MTDIMVETWIAIPGYLWRYEVSDLGRVRNVRTGKILKPVLTGRESRRYFRVSVGERNNQRINRLVLLGFVGSPPTPDHQAAHLNGDRLDNRLSNLAWVTQTENFSHKRLHGTALVGEKNHQAALTAAGVSEVMQRLAQGESYRSVARRLGVTDRTVRRIASGETWSHVATPVLKPKWVRPRCACGRLAGFKIEKPEQWWCKHCGVMIRARREGPG